MQLIIDYIFENSKIFIDALLIDDSYTKVIDLKKVQISSSLKDELMILEEDVENSKTEITKVISFFDNIEKSKIFETEKEKMIAQQNNMLTFDNSVTSILTKLGYDISLTISKQGIVLPDIMKHRIIELSKNPQTFEYEFEKLNKFWTRCQANSNGDSIKNLFAYIEKSGLYITNNGNLITFRRVWKCTLDDKILADKVSKVLVEYTKIINSGKNPKDYAVYEIAEKHVVLNGQIDFARYISDLDTYFKENKTVWFTDNHTKTFKFVPGTKAVVQDFDINPDATCSKGLHSGSKEYVSENKWLGDTIIWTMIDPIDIVACVDNASKIRSKAQYIGGIVENIDEFTNKSVNFEIENDVVIKTLNNIQFSSFTEEQVGSLIHTKLSDEKAKQLLNV